MGLKYPKKNIKNISPSSKMPLQNFTFDTFSKTQASVFVTIVNLYFDNSIIAATIVQIKTWV